MYAQTWLRYTDVSVFTMWVTVKKEIWLHHVSLSLQFLMFGAHFVPIFTMRSVVSSAQVNIGSTGNTLLTTISKTPETRNLKINNLFLFPLPDNYNKAVHMWTNYCMFFFSNTLLFCVKISADMRYFRMNMRQTWCGTDRILVIVLQCRVSLCIEFIGDYPITLLYLRLWLLFYKVLITFLQ